jgi:hypothetical protein
MAENRRGVIYAHAPTLEEILVGIVRTDTTNLLVERAGIGLPVRSARSSQETGCFIQTFASS